MGVYTLILTVHRLGTHNIAPNTTDEVDESHPQPTNGTLNLDPHVQLNHHHYESMDDTEMNKNGHEPPPELVCCRPPWLVVLLPNKGRIEATDVFQAIHLITSVILWMEDTSPGGAFINVHHLTVASD